MCFGSGAKGVASDETLTSSANASSSHQESDDVGMYTAWVVPLFFRKMLCFCTHELETPFGFVSEDANIAMCIWAVDCSQTAIDCSCMFVGNLEDWPLVISALFTRYYKVVTTCLLVVVCFHFLLRSGHRYKET
jgi:hypothetical protein